MTGPGPYAERFARARRRAGEALAEGRGGVEVARALSDDFDEILRDRADAVPAGVAILATGGYGRREMAPFADLDLLVLCDGPPGERGAAVADAVLYPLWDAKVDAGHAVRAVDEALALPATDLAAATALLDARPLAGDPSLADRFLAAFAARVADTSATDFVARLRAEQESRHSRFGDTIFLLEPDIKNGPGGLRDLCVGRWACKARFGTGDVRALERLGETTGRRAAALEAALAFYLRVRAAAHLHAGRRQDQLRFAIQEAVAPRLYPDARAPEGEVRPAVAPAVEALMHAFQGHARAVRRETERLLQRATAPARPAPVTRVRLPRATDLDPSFVLREFALEVLDPEIFARTPSEMVRLFSAAIALDADIAPGARDLVADHAATPARAQALRGDPDSGARFLGVLGDSTDRAAPTRLEQMQDLGLVAALIPEWAPVVGRVQHDIYHVYTVDQHSLYAVARLHALWRGDLEREHPEATEAARAAESPLALALGTLLHDVGKPLAGVDHPDRGADLIPVIARRLGLDGDDAARAEFLVRRHLVMSHLSQRRDLEDQGMIADLAGLCGDEENLRALYVLTFCDLMAVSPGNLTGWKASLLRGLYQRTQAYLRRGPDLLGAERAELVRLRRRRAAKLLGEDPSSPELAGLFASLPDRYFTENTARRIAAHVGLMRARAGRPCLIDVRPRRVLGFSELVVVADDAPGLLADVAGVLLANRVDVVDAAIYSRRAAEAGGRGEALDLFRVRDAYGRAITERDRWAAVRTDLEAVLGGHRTAADLLARHRKRPTLPPRHVPEVLTEIRVDNEASREFTVVEVITQDRPGVLHAIARTLHDEGLDIHRSKVATEGGRVADVFYVRDGATGDRITDEARLAQVKASLASALPR